MINEFGLYRNVKPRYLIPDLKSDRTLDEQTQGWWLPYYDKEGNIHLVDTYHISGIYKGYGNDFLNNFIEDKNNKKDDSFLIGKSNFDYCYGGSVKITPTTEQYFELVNEETKTFNEKYPNGKLSNGNERRYNVVWYSKTGQGGHVAV